MVLLSADEPFYSSPGEWSPHEASAYLQPSYHGSQIDSELRDAASMPDGANHRSVKSVRTKGAKHHDYPAHTADSRRKPGAQKQADAVSARASAQRGAFEAELAEVNARLADAAHAAVALAVTSCRGQHRDDSAATALSSEQMRALQMPKGQSAPGVLSQKPKRVQKHLRSGEGGGGGVGKKDGNGSGQNGCSGADADSFAGESGERRRSYSGGGGGGGIQPRGALPLPLYATGSECTRSVNGRASSHAPERASDSGLDPPPEDHVNLFVETASVSSLVPSETNEAPEAGVQETAVERLGHLSDNLETPENEAFQSDGEGAAEGPAAGALPPVTESSSFHGSSQPGVDGKGVRAVRSAEPSAETVTCQVPCTSTNAGTYPSSSPQRAAGSCHTQKRPAQRASSRLRRQASEEKLRFAESLPFLMPITPWNAKGQDSVLLALVEQGAAIGPTPQSPTSSSDRHSPSRTKHALKISSAPAPLSPAAEQEQMLRSSSSLQAVRAAERRAATYREPACVKTSAPPSRFSSIVQKRSSPLDFLASMTNWEVQSTSPAVGGGSANGRACSLTLPLDMPTATSTSAYHGASLPLESPKQAAERASQIDRSPLRRTPRRDAPNTAVNSRAREWVALSAAIDLSAPSHGGIVTSAQWGDGPITIPRHVVDSDAILIRSPSIRDRISHTRPPGVSSIIDTGGLSAANASARVAARIEARNVAKMQSPARRSSSKVLEEMYRTETLDSGSIGCLLAADRFTRQIISPAALQPLRASCNALR